MNDQPIDPAELAAFEAYWQTTPTSKLRYGASDSKYVAEKAWIARARQEHVQAGWQVVPVEPTKKMLVALNMNTFGFSMETADNTLRIMWAQALAAAPKGP